MTKKDIEKTRNSAYKKFPQELTTEEAIEILLTSDGKGRMYKNRALKRLIEIITRETLDRCAESLGNINVMRDALLEEIK